jgi:hypothetical protein
MNTDQSRITVLYGLVGADLGVVLTMVVFSDPGTGKTSIEVGTIHTLAGAFAGVWLGSGLVRLVALRPAAGRWVTTIGVVLLTTLLGASVGWIAGAVQARNGWEHDTMTRRGVLVGAAIGPLFGLVIAAPLWLRRLGDTSGKPASPQLGPSNGGST